MTSIYSRGAGAPLLAGLVLIGALSACGSSGDSPPAQKPPPTSTPLSVSTSSLPKGQVGANYSAPLAATGGTAPYHWALASGALPAGLTLAASGTITGTPSAAANAASISLNPRTITDGAISMPAFRPASRTCS